MLYGILVIHKHNTGYGLLNKSLERRGLVPDLLLGLVCFVQLRSHNNEHCLCGTLMAWKAGSGGRASGPDKRLLSTTA